jgi:hypothetical protein
MKALAYNVAAFDKVLGLATQVGDSYKPGNASIERTALIALLEESRKSITAVLKAEGEVATAVNQRQTAFEMLPQLSAQIVSLAESCGMDEKDLEDLKSLQRRFRSQPFKTSADQVNSTVQTAEPLPEPRKRRNRQLSFDNKVVNMEAMIQFLEDHPAYRPTEWEFSADGLKQKLAMLTDANTLANQARSALTGSRAKAKKLVFDRSTGIYGRARMAKKYLRVALGSDADLYKAVKKIKFKNKA